MSACMHAVGKFFLGLTSSFECRSSCSTTSMMARLSGIISMSHPYETLVARQELLSCPLTIPHTLFMKKSTAADLVSDMHLINGLCALAASA